MIVSRGNRSDQFGWTAPTTAGAPVDMCPGCGSSSLVDFFHLPDLPVDVGTLYSSHTAAVGATTGDITLAYCRTCGLVRNRAFDHAKPRFEPGYEVALQHSTVFRTYIEGLADRLIGRYALRRKRIVELGCGDGYFLRQVCRRGDNEGVGIDPTVTREGYETLSPGRVRLVRDLFTDAYADLECDFVCCLSVFEDIPQPLDFLRTVKALAGRRDEVPVYFEVFNAFRAFQEREIWSVHYEQCNYFSLESLVGLFQRGGFRIVDFGTCYQGDQYLYVEAMSDETGRRRVPPARPAPDRLPDAVAGFRDHYRERLQLWTDRLDTFARAGRKVVLWGSGGKGNSFLNALRVKHEIRYVVDINPDRQGKYIPGTGHLIVGPDRLRVEKPDVVVLTNALYESEIRQQVRELGLACEFLFA